MRKRIINAHRYENLIILFSGATFLLATLKIISIFDHWEIPSWIEIIIISIELVFAFLIFVLGFLVSPVDFIHLFSDYCTICTYALSKIKNPCEVYTIQTPILIQEDTEKPYNKYLTATAKSLIRLGNDGSHLVTSYRRLVVVNSNDQKEKRSEKNKLISFVKALFKEVEDHPPPYNGNLQNVKILIAKWEDINRTPYLNMDILMIGGNFLNIAIPVYHRQTKSYEWGTSINIQKNSLLKTYKFEISTFKRIYEDAWDSGVAANPRNLIEMTIQAETDLKSQEEAFVKTINDIFNVI